MGWLGKGFPNENLKVNYVSYNNQLSYSLGNGLFAILNARGKNHPLGPDLRFEAFYKKAQELNRNRDLGDGRVFYDKTHNNGFIKSQQIQAFINNKPITLVVCGLPRRINLNETKRYEDVISEAHSHKGIIGINGPKSIETLIDCSLFDLQLDAIDFFVGYSSNATFNFGTNKTSLEFYNQNLAEKYFGGHSIGCVAASMHHRNKGLGTPSVGKSYTKFYSSYQNITHHETFISVLRDDLQKAQPKDCCMRPLFIEPFRHIASIMIGDNIKNLFPKKN